MTGIKKVFAEVLHAFGFTVHRNSSVFQTEALERSGTLLHLLASSPLTKDLTLEQSLGIISKAKSQLGQDVLAISQLGIGKEGYFVEFGATNGVDLSNTFLLEKEFGWSGILCEPAKEWHGALHLNRTCALDTRCVYSETGGKIEFSETTAGELSTISSFVNFDENRKHRKNATSYEVETVTLKDLLAKHKAPRYVDFLSIDTEGSEFEILNGFDFAEYVFGLICVEHNFTENRGKIESLLLKHGYSKVFPEYSKWDDWYVKSRE